MPARRATSTLTDEELTGERRPTPLPAPGERSLPELHVLGFGVSHKRLEQAVRELQLPVTLVREPDEADVVITLRNYFKQKAPALREAEERGLPIFVLKSNTLIQIESALTSIFALEVDPRDAALREVEEAIGLVHAQAQAGRAVAAERLHPAAAAPDGRAGQPRVAVARARAVPPSSPLPGSRPRPTRLSYRPRPTRPWPAMSTPATSTTTALRTGTRRPRSSDVAAGKRSTNWRA